MLSTILKKGRAKSYYYSVAGNLLSTTSQWVVLMLVSKLYGTVQMGQYALAMAWIMPLYAFFSMQIRNIHVSDQEGKYGFNLFFKIRLVCTVLFFAVVCAIGLLFYRDILIVFIMGGLFKSFEMTSDMIHAEFHKRRKIAVYSKQLILRSVLSMVLAFVLFSIIPSFQLALVSLPLAYCCTLLADMRLLSKEGVKIQLNQRYTILRQVAFTGLSTGVSLLLLYMLPNIPRYVLETSRSSFELGIFSGYVSLILFARIFVQSIVQNSLPYLAENYDKGNLDKFISRLKKEGLIVTALGLLQFLLVPVSGYIFPLLFNNDFAGNKVLLCLVFASSTLSFIAFVLNNGINAMKLYRVQLPVYSVMVGLSLALAFWLIPGYGLNGAGLTIVVVNFAVCLTLGGIIITRLYSKTNAPDTLSQPVEVC